VLAATSVLGDLVEKCPPAEACRDAFDRMSKATIQMCMSTTGFGPQALRGHPQTQTQPPTQPSHSPSTTYTSISDTDARSDTEMVGYIPAGYFQPGRRPVPRFDMDLKDLFSENETDKQSMSRISNQVGSMRPPPPPQQVKQETQQMQPYTTGIKFSPQMRGHQSSAQQQTLTYAQAQAQKIPSPQFPTSTAPNLSPLISQPQPAIPSPYQISNQLPYNSFAQNIASTYPDFGFSELDFLDSFPVQGSGSIGNGGDLTGVGGVQDLGFGMDFGDGTHDWSDGNGFELLGGFFFGGGGGGGNGM
jgi:hypothetical protein